MKKLCRHLYAYLYVLTVCDVIGVLTCVVFKQVLTFLMMYRTHCQRILDTVIRANFDEVMSISASIKNLSVQFAVTFSEKMTLMR